MYAIRSYYARESIPTKDKTAKPPCGCAVLTSKSRIRPVVAGFSEVNRKVRAFRSPDGSPEWAFTRIFPALPWAPATRPTSK